MSSTITFEPRISFNYLAEQKKPVTNSQEIETLVEFLPETTKVNEFVDAFFNNFHDDKKLDSFASFFANFKDKTPNEIFFLYKLALTDLVKDYINFAPLKGQFDRKLKELEIDHKKEDLLKEVISKNIINSHEGLPTLAIAKALEKKIDSIDLSGKDVENKITLQDQKTFKELFDKSIQVLEEKDSLNPV